MNRRGSRLAGRIGPPTTGWGDARCGACAVGPFLLLLVVLGTRAGSRRSAAEPPWCGTPEPDGTAALAGRQPSRGPTPVGSFPHIPHYGDRLHAQRHRVHAATAAAGGGDRQVRRSAATCSASSSTRLDSAPAPAATTRPGRPDPLARARESGGGPAGAAGRRATRSKVPIFVQAGIHGNESEGIDASIDIIEKYATTPYGDDPVVDGILDHADPPSST